MHVASGTSAIVAMGTTGESATLNVDEHCKVISFVVEKTAGRIPVIAGTGANSTQEAIALTAAAARAKADACLLVTPYYNKPTQEGLYLHHKAIAEAVAIPQILYNVPGRTACDMLTDTVDRLADIDNIIAIKDATGDMNRAKELISRCGDRMAIYSGDDETFVEFMALGGKGNISVTANVAPVQMSKICAAALAGDFDQARELNQPLHDLHKALFCEANPIPVKWAMERMGLMGPGIRLPLTRLSDIHQPRLEKALNSAGLLV
jgi:4-hydroxy-tetrahydrodipicolinate synthase